MHERFPRKDLFDTEARSLFCATVGRTYQLSVALPQSYRTSDQTYPVLYLLDGDLFVGMAAGLTPLSHWCLNTPEIIIVGIGYDMESYDQWLQLRERDFKLPEVPDAPDDSAADAFLHVLTHEIIPFIEADYRVTPSDRCLYGYSSSGFFVLYTFAHHPDAFQRYICGSGDLYLAYPYLRHHCEQLAARTASNPIRLYISAGTLESHQFPCFHELTAFLEAASYPGITVITELYPGEYHGAEGAALAYLHGIRTVYTEVGPPTPIALG